MPVNIGKYKEIQESLAEKARLVAVSKIRSVDEIKLLYSLGQRDFGENYVQELVAKQPVLPPDIRWHFIGHLQSNKVKYIAPFIHLIQGVDSFKLLEEINKQAIRLDKTINCLLQVHIAQEETKFGLNEKELNDVIRVVPSLKAIGKPGGIKICGLMGMGSQTDDKEQVRKEFRYLKCLFDDTRDEFNKTCFKTLSMGMSDDYRIALEEGSNMVRIGSLLFGPRNNPPL